MTAGHRPDMRIIAGTGHDPTLLAEIRTGSRVAAAAGERRLYAATHTRHSNRPPFPARHVPDEVWAGLAAARPEGAEMWPVDRHGVPEILELVGEAERHLESDPAYRAELDAWTSDRHRLDGV